MRKLMKPAILAAMLLLLSVARVVWAGPPFQTDDPEPVDFQNYEFYTFGNTDGTGVETDAEGLALEFNWGAVPNVQLHLVVPLAGIRPSNNPVYAPAGAGPNAYGLGDIEAGIKFRFLAETKHRPMVGTFTMFELPSGDATIGLGVGRTWYRVPIWIQKSFGPWTTYEGAGATLFSHSPGYRDFPFAGWLVQRELGKKLTLGTEAYFHGPEGLATAQTQSATLIDFGGYYYFRNPGFQLLFCYGHTVSGQPENYAYLGLYWTWGKKKEGSDEKETADLGRFAPLDQPGQLAALRPR